MLCMLNMNECEHGFRIMPLLVYCDRTISNSIENRIDHRIISKDDAAVMITLMWSIWHSRNSYTHGEEEYQPHQSMIIIEEIVRALDIPVKEKMRVQQKVQWRAPVVGWIKLNTDGATDSDRALGGAGIIIRDHSGTCMGARCAKYDYMRVLLIPSQSSY